MLRQLMEQMLVEFMQEAKKKEIQEHCAVIDWLRPFRIWYWAFRKCIVKGDEKIQDL
jgi:hypothetical protein